LQRETGSLRNRGAERLQPVEQSRGGRRILALAAQQRIDVELLGAQLRVEHEILAEIRRAMGRVEALA